MEALDRFNARDLSASEVASTFVAPPEFDTLCRGNNSLLLGPRGSGKTTLLKMLTPEATESRELHQHLDVGRPTFAGVYVPLDVQLAESLERMGSSGLDPEIVSVGAEALFALHSFRRIALTAAWFCSSAERHSRERLLDAASEARLVAELGLLWGAETAVPTIQTLLADLRRQQVRATEQWRQAILATKYGGPFDMRTVNVVDLDGGLKGGLESLGRHIPWAGPRFAVLFDEVELAPPALQTLLLSYLRHSEESVLFKLAVSPYMSGVRGLSESATASAMNDYDPIDLASLSEEAVRQFSERFFSSAAIRRGLGAVSLRQALGPSELNPVDSGNSSEASYGESSPQARRLRNLARKDESFRSYLLSQGLNERDIVSGSDSDDRAPFRKVRQVALLRDAYLSDSSTSGRRIKARNDARRLYTGAETIVRMCEGNPRRLAFVVPLLLNGLTSSGQIPRGTQMAAVETTQAAFRSFLRGIRVSPQAGPELPRGVLTFLDLLGETFHGAIVGPSFNADPVGAFTVHSSASALVEEMVARAVNAGALVQLSSHDDRGSYVVPKNMAPVDTSRGKRFRLSYLLAPGYGIPVRVLRQQSLETILKTIRDSEGGASKRAASALLNQQGVLL